MIFICLAEVQPETTNSVWLETRSTLIPPIVVLTNHLIKAKTQNSVLHTCASGICLRITAFLVRMKTLIISNFQISQTSSELISTSSELISTSSELISTGAELISTGAELISTGAELISTNLEIQTLFLNCLVFSTSNLIFALAKRLWRNW